MKIKIADRPVINTPSYPKPNYCQACEGIYANQVSFYPMKLRFWRTTSKKYKKALYLASLFPLYTPPTKSNNYWAEIIIDNELNFYVYYNVLYELLLLSCTWKYVEHYIDSKICYHNEFYVYSWSQKSRLGDLETEQIDVQSQIRKFNDRWTHEKELFSYIQNLFPTTNVIRHFRAPWLEGLELDIFIESLNIGIEYQGIQHYQPVEHWGGKSGFIKRRLNDIKKKQLCEHQGITLIYFTYQENITCEYVQQKLAKYCPQVYNKT